MCVWGGGNTLLVIVRYDSVTPNGNNEMISIIPSYKIIPNSREL